MAENDRSSRDGSGNRGGSSSRKPSRGSSSAPRDKRAGGSRGERGSDRGSGSRGSRAGTPSGSKRGESRQGKPSDASERSRDDQRSSNRDSRDRKPGEARDRRGSRDDQRSSNRDSRDRKPGEARDRRGSRGSSGRDAQRDDRSVGSRGARDDRATDSRSRGGDARGRPSDSRSRPSDPRSRASDTRGRPADSRSRPKDSAVAPTEFTDGLGDIDVRVLPRDVLRDLETLSIQTKPRVERWLAASRLAMEDDPEKAYEYAKQAGKLAGRVAVVRETIGIAAYQAGDYKTAKAELMAARRMAGREVLIPLLADCERALGKPQRALDIAHEPAAGTLRGEARAELLLVESGARRDLGQKDAAAAVLRGPCAETRTTAPWAVRLYYGYADALLEAGDKDSAREWFMKALGADVEEETDADDRLAELDG